jgi:hypothetical protein
VHYKFKNLNLLFCSIFPIFCSVFTDFCSFFTEKIFYFVFGRFSLFFVRFSPFFVRFSQIFRFCQFCQKYGREKRTKTIFCSFFTKILFFFDFVRFSRIFAHFSLDPLSYYAWKVRYYFKKCLC